MQVSVAGSKSWYFRYIRNKRGRNIGLGAAPTISLAEARNRAADARKLLDEGIDPPDARKTLQMRGLKKS